MKKRFVTITLFSIACVHLLCAQEQTNNADKTDKTDKKIRFGLRITPQPTWFSSNDRNIAVNGSKFGFGFGLNMEYRFTNVISVLSGLGGDFEGGKYSFRNDPGFYQVYYELSETGEFTKPLNGLNAPVSAIKKTANIGYWVKQRTLNTTYITIPAILKLSTGEYSGSKYFGMFGVELALRAKATVNDSYYASFIYSHDAEAPVNSPATDQKKIDIGGFKGDGRSGIMRVGLNVGVGTEYRIGGTTFLFASINYFRSFTNGLKSESEYLAYKNSVSGDQITSSFIKQNLIHNAFRINLGFMF